MLAKAKFFYENSRNCFGTLDLIQYTLYCTVQCAVVQSRKLKSRYGASNRFQAPSLELSSQTIHAQAVGPVRQPYAYLIPSTHKRDLCYRLCIV